MIKIIHTMPDIDSEASGPSYCVTRLCESIIKTKGRNDIELKLALTGSNNNEKSYINTFPRVHWPNRLAFSPKMYMWLKKQVSTKSVDIVHNHSMWMMPNVYPGWATKKSNCKYVVSPHGTFSKWAMASGSRAKKIFWPLLQRPSITHACCFHATCVSEYEDIRRLGFRQPIAIIENGIDLPELRIFPKNKHRNLLYFGRLHPVKGLENLLIVWAKLQSAFPDWSLSIVGPDDGSYATFLKSIVAERNLERVFFKGPVYGASKYELYQKADLYVLPTFSENFAMTVAEALSCGLPAVVTQGAPWEGLVTENAGWWPEIGVEPLLHTLREAMSLDSDNLRQMGLNGRDWMDRCFAWDMVALNMIDTYEWLVGLSSTPPNCIVVD